MKISLTPIATLKLDPIGLDEVLVLRSDDNEIYLETPFLPPCEDGMVAEDGTACFSAKALMDSGEPMLIALAQRAVDQYGSN